MPLRKLVELRCPAAVAGDLAVSIAEIRLGLVLLVFPAGRVFDELLDDVLDDRLMTIGVEYGFGQKSGRRMPVQDDQLVDSDGDGVLDIWDEGDKTPPGGQVTSRGC